VDDGTRSPPVQGKILIAGHFIDLQVEDQASAIAKEGSPEIAHKKHFKEIALRRPRELRWHDRCGTEGQIGSP
jgi:hypothetical protein